MANLSSPIPSHYILYTKPKCPKPPCTPFQPNLFCKHPLQSSKHPFQSLKHQQPRVFSTIPKVSSSSSSKPSSGRTTIPQPNKSGEEQVFFDGGSHYGDLLANLIFGFSLLWMPLTVAAVFRAMFLRYRFTNLRVTVMSGITGSDRRDFSYNVVQDVQVVPRLIGEWGDVIITLTDGTKVDLRSVPKFREIAAYCLYQAGKEGTNPTEATGPKGFL